MSFIEFTGMVGAGKSTVATALAAALQQHDQQVFTPVAASRHCLDRSLLGRLGRRLLPGVWQRGRNPLLRHLVHPFYLFLFTLAYPRLIWLVCRSQQHRPLTWRHRRLILKRFGDVAGHFHFLRSRLQPDELVIFEEGFVHRAINLFAWDEDPLDVEQLWAYYQQLPTLDLLIVVEAPTAVCQQRAQQRGLPTSLADKDEATQQRFTRHSARIIQLALSAAADHRPIICLDNSHSLAETLRRLQASLPPTDQVLSNRSGLTW